MSKIAVILACALAACQHVHSKFEWKAMYYSVLSREVMLWEASSADACILGAGRTELIERLRSLSRSGHAQLLIERIPAPGLLPPLPTGQIASHRRVMVRGVPIEPQCESSKYLYWIVDFRYLGPFPPDFGERLP